MLTAVRKWWWIAFVLAPAMYGLGLGVVTVWKDFKDELKLSVHESIMGGLREQEAKLQAENTKRLETALEILGNAATEMTTAAASTAASVSGIRAAARGQTSGPIAPVMAATLKAIKEIEDKDKAR